MLNASWLGDEVREPMGDERDGMDISDGVREEDLVRSSGVGRRSKLSAATLTLLPDLPRSTREVQEEGRRLVCPWTPV